MIGSTGSQGMPWPELLPDRSPVLVLPAHPARPLVLEDGWTDRDTARCHPAGPQPGWSAVMADARLIIHRPDGATWFDGEIAATREWRRRIREQRTLLLITGAFTGVFDFPDAAATGRLLLLTTPIRLAAGS
ncbi:hypothetical protein [Streptomyces sp. NRRL S-350]|uniref:hypothetical protein n=1 Tax=Streptomyces sp. NRRL S-350 TaxID=1463902 RepID=UPI000D141853|nr:hypothetical protein [Streptomyces sp. NRRL S-350]